MTAPTPPPNPVVEAGSFECPNSGKRKLSGASSTAGVTIKLTVSGSPVVTVSDGGGAGTYTGCSFSDSNGNHVCASTTISSSGATKLTAGGNAVLLTSDTVQAVNPVVAGSGKAKITAGQTKLTAV